MGLLLIASLLYAYILVSPSQGGNILVLSTKPFSSPSHYMVLSTVTGGLVSNGHNVTLISSTARRTMGFPNGTFSQVLYYEANYSQSEADMNMKYGLSWALSNNGLFNTLQLLSKIYRTFYLSCDDLWRDTKLVERLKYMSSFDLVLILNSATCDLLMAHYLDIPFALVYSTIRTPTFHEGMIGMPYPSAYVPFNIFTSFTEEMTFFERLENLLIPIVFDIFQHIVGKQYYEIQERFNIDPDKSIKELYSKASLFLSHTSLSIDFARPFTPNVIPIGGLIAHPSKPLSKELNDFIEGSEDHGAILFSLGSALLGLDDDTMTETFATVFGKLPQRVLWRHNSKTPSNICSNTKLVQWLPQNDLLGHPNTRLLIYHGGSNGVSEAIYHGVPMVIIPMFRDQFAHGARIQKKGMGLVLDKQNITEESLLAVIREVLYNPSYKKQVQLYSDIHHDNLITPLKRALYWIEHVIKFGDAHLRPRSADMGVIELYQIDVILFLVGILIIVLYIEYLAIRKCCSSCQITNSPKRKAE